MTFGGPSGHHGPVSTDTVHDKDAPDPEARPKPATDDKAWPPHALEAKDTPPAARK